MQPDFIFTVMGTTQSTDASGGGSNSDDITISRGDIVGPSPIDPGQLPTSVSGVISTVMFWIAILSVAMIIIGGILYATSAADETRTRQAKATIKYAIVGLIVSLLSWAIVNLVATLV